MPDDIPKLPRQRGKKNQPKDTAWKQQKLPALRPHYDIASAIPVTLLIGVITLAMGIALYFGHMGSLEQEIVYTNCAVQNGSQVSRLMRNEVGNQTFQCSYSIVLDQDFTGDVKFSYGLTKFYQNNRLYFNSRNDQQLRGKITEIDGCDPLQYVEMNGTKVPIAPCGFVANSMFNEMSHRINQHQEDVDQLD
uniref:Cell cycle control protein 50C n=1 Tax=Caenorhabditis tropicalis TaxID=1561998 RepID=A0A1I7TPK1_9PELO